MEGLIRQQKLYYRALPSITAPLPPITALLPPITALLPSITALLPPMVALYCRLLPHSITADYRSITAFYRLLPLSVLETEQMSAVGIGLMSPLGTRHVPPTPTLVPREEISPTSTADICSVSRTDSGNRR